MPDEIIEELWRIKDEIAREHGYDTRKIVEYLQGKYSQEPRVGTPPSDSSPIEEEEGSAAAGQAALESQSAGGIGSEPVAE